MNCSTCAGQDKARILLICDEMRLVRMLWLVEALLRDKCQ